VAGYAIFTFHFSFSKITTNPPNYYIQGIEKVKKEVLQKNSQEVTALR
jgi:hypothetical protein